MPAVRYCANDTPSGSVLLWMSEESVSRRTNGRIDRERDRPAIPRDQQRPRCGTLAHHDLGAAHLMAPAPRRRAEVHVLERRTANLEPVELPAVLGVQLGDERRRRRVTRSTGAPSSSHRTIATSSERSPSVPRRRVGDDAAVVDDDDAVRERVGLLHVVRREQDRRPLGLERPDQLPERASRLGVEARRRLVEEEELRCAHDAERDVESSALPSGQRLRRARPPSR